MAKFHRATDASPRLDGIDSLSDVVRGRFGSRVWVHGLHPHSLGLAIVTSAGAAHSRGGIKHLDAL